jgi:hypothetical protein
MNLLFFPLLVAQSLTTTNAIPLNRTCNRVECYDEKIFLAPRIGQSIFSLVERDSLDPISFTDDVNYRIRDFKITPFAIYINRGNALEKFYVTSGKKEIIYESGDISSFTLTPAEEIILADRQTRELIFLDFANQFKFKIGNLSVEDVVWDDTIAYVLTTNTLNQYDEHGNLIDTRPIPEQCSRILVADRKIMIFSEQRDYIYESDTDWRRIGLSLTISDICATNKVYIILNGLGNTLYLYSRDDF